jgi:hypothetical protein
LLVAAWTGRVAPATELVGLAPGLVERVESLTEVAKAGVGGAEHRAGEIGRDRVHPPRQLLDLDHAVAEVLERPMPWRRRQTRRRHELRVDPPRLGFEILGERRQPVDGCAPSPGAGDRPPGLVDAAVEPAVEVGGAALRRLPPERHAPVPAPQAPGEERGRRGSQNEQPDLHDGEGTARRVRRRSGA